MKFSAALLFSSSALGYITSAYSSVYAVSTDIQTIYSCGSSVTDCPYKNKTTPDNISTYEGGAADVHGSYYAAGVAALAAGAFLL